jgi:hypothetical protein
MEDAVAVMNAIGAGGDHGRLRRRLFGQPAWRGSAAPCGAVWKAATRSWRPVRDIEIERGVELVRYRREGRSAEVPVDLLVASRALGK